MLVLLCLLAVVAIHRIWHYEDVTALFRSVLPMDPAFTPLLIAPCVMGWSLVDHPAVLPSLAVLACYPILRGAVWAYKKFDPQPVCTPCQERQQEMADMAEQLRKWPKRVIVFGSPRIATLLARLRRKYLFICLDEHEKARTERNILYYPLAPVAVPAMLPFLIAQGGNATIVMFQANTSPWHMAVAQVGSMKGVAWVHVTDQKVTVPAHHRVIAPDADWDTVIDAAPAPE
jgi:hypothetical protein